MKIKYIGYYCTDKNTDAYISPAAVTKMTYIAECMKKAGHEVEIVSLSGIGKKKFNFKRSIIPENLIKVTYVSSLPRKNPVLRLLNSWWTYCSLFWYLLRQVKKGDILLVYHSVGFVNIWRGIQKIKGCKICLEVEEIYQDAQEMKAVLRKREYKAFQWADAFIYPTNLLELKTNTGHDKPYVIVHGSYRLPAESESVFEDQLVHVVYAGTFNQKKGGVTIAVKTGEFLRENYHLHVIGFGNEQETEQVLQLIEYTDQKSKCHITYDGCKMGEEYDRFMQSCQIGLSTQRSDNELNDTSFPSKILSYLSNDVQVVTAKIKVVEESAVGDIVYYYTEDEPREIAKIVELAAHRSNKNGRKRLIELDMKFERELDELLKQL